MSSRFMMFSLWCTSYAFWTVLALCRLGSGDVLFVRAKADISKQAGMDSCKFMYLGDNDIYFYPSFNKKACLAQNGTVYCGDMLVKCGSLGLDYTSWDNNGWGTIYHWKQSADGRVLNGYRCTTRVGEYGCDGVVGTAVFNYSSRVNHQEVKARLTVDTSEPEPTQNYGWWKKH